MDFEVGGRSEGPFLRLYERLPEAVLYRSGAYQVYAGWLPPERHVVGKGGAVNRGGAVNWNEGLDSGRREKLNRLVHQAKGYTKKVEMPVYSLAPVCWRQWRKSNIHLC